MRMSRRVGLNNSSISLDVGSEAILRSSNMDFGTCTLIYKDNPVEAPGIITELEIYTGHLEDMTNCWVGMFYTSDEVTFSTRSHVYIGNLAQQTKHIIPVSLEVEAGDYIGIYCDQGTLTSDFEEGVYWNVIGLLAIPCTNQAFSVGTVSSYGSLFGSGKG